MTDEKRSRYTHTIISSKTQRVWLPLFAGLILGFVGMHLIVARPMKKQLEKELLAIRSEMKQASIKDRKIEAQGKSIDNSNALLVSLNSQGRLIDESNNTIDRLEQLGIALQAQADKVTNSFIALETLAELQDEIVSRTAHSDQVRQSLDTIANFNDRILDLSVDLERTDRTLSRLTDLKAEIANHSSDLDQAEEIAERYRHLKNSITAVTDDLNLAELNAEKLIAMMNRLAEELGTTHLAESNLDSFVHLHRRLSADSRKIQETFRMYEAIVASRNKMQSEIESLQQIRKWIQQQAVLQPIVSQAKRTFQPVAELVKLFVKNNVDGNVTAKANLSPDRYAASSSEIDDRLPLMAPKPRNVRSETPSFQWENFAPRNE